MSCWGWNPNSRHTKTPKGPFDDGDPSFSNRSTIPPQESELFAMDTFTMETTKKGKGKQNFVPRGAQNTPKWCPVSPPKGGLECMGGTWCILVANEVGWERSPVLVSACTTIGAESKGSCE